MLFRSVGIDELTTEQLREWLEMVATSPAQRGTGKPFPHPTPDDRQRRRHTANAILSTLCAALNLAFREGKAANDAAWRRVRKFRDLRRVRVRYLSEEEARRLVAASPQEFQRLILGALYTGCRAGELIAMNAGALNRRTNRLYVAPGKSNWARWLALPDEAVGFFQHLAAGRGEQVPMFVRDGGGRWKIAEIQAHMVLARKKAGLGNDVVFHTLRHTYASYLVMAGASLLAVMKLLGHADIRLVVQCYAHLSPDFLADTVRLHFPKFMASGAGASREGREVSIAASRQANASLPQRTIEAPVPVDERGSSRYWNGDPSLANPAAIAARRWESARRGQFPQRLTYGRLAGKI